VSAQANVASAGIFEGGTALSTTFFKTLNLSTQNNKRNLDSIGNMYAIDTQNGTSMLISDVRVFFRPYAAREIFGWL